MTAITKFLYVGQLDPTGTCYARMEALCRLGVEAVPFDVLPYVKSATRVERVLISRLKMSPAITKLNRDLQRLARVETFDAVWVDKGVWIWPETLQTLKNRAKHTFAVHYTPDTQFLANRSRLFFNSIVHYDLLVTTKPFEVEAYNTHGAKQTVLVLQGYGRQFKPADNSAAVDLELASDVCFVGHCAAERIECIKLASQVSGSVAVWGWHWERASRAHPWLRPIVRGEGVWGERYPAALRASKIALGLLIKYVPETTTTRTFEIPATGTFMLAERTDDHAALFEEGKEAEFFSSEDEMVDKIRFYLAHDAERLRIAAAGRERCVKSGYSDECQLRRVLEAMRQSDSGRV